MKTIRIIAASVAAAGLLVAAVLFLRGRATPPEQTAPPKEETAADPANGTGPQDPADEEKQEDELRAKVLVTDRAAEERKAKTGYIHDPKLPGGTLKGICYVKYDKAVRLYPPFPLELEGDNAIRDPQEGEHEYYASRRPVPVVYLGRYAPDEKRYGVKGAVIRIPGIAAGRRRKFDRLRYQIDFRNHQIVPAKPEGRGVFNPSAYNVGVMHTKQLVQVLNLSLYGSHLVLTDPRTGEKMWEQVAQRYHDPKFPGEHLGSNPVMDRPTVYQIPRIDRSGAYVLTCRRHPWQKAYLVLSDNPYAAVSVDDGDYRHRHPDRAGEFVIDGIPPGTHTVEVWHPELEPVQRTLEVDIAMDRTTPLTIKFKPPDLLEKTSKPLPDKTITEWAFVGPFYPLMDEEPDAPNNNLDFDAAYDGRDEQVRWKYVNVGRGRSPGYVEMHKVMWRIRDLSLCYSAVRMNSPKAQKLHLLVDNEADGLKIWLNGALIFRSYTGDFGRYHGRYRDGLLATGDLKAGRNTLLILVSAERTEGARFAVKYRAPGVTLEAPVKNIAPRARATDATCPEGGSVTLALPIEDADHAARGQMLKATVTREPKHGKLVRRDATTFVYHARRGYAGKDRLAWKPEDGLDAGRPVEVTLTIPPDKAPPRIVKVVAKTDQDTVRVRFSEPVDAASACKAANWAIDHGVKIKDATLGEDGTTVALATSPLSAKVESYTLTAKGIKDRAQDPNAAACTAAFRFVKVQPGLRYAYYAQPPKGDGLKFFKAMKPKRTGVATQIGLTGELGELGEAFSLRFDGKIKIPADGTYVFFTTSDDGSRLYVAGRPVVTNDGTHGMAEASGKQELAAGLHPITVTFYQGGGGKGLEVAWSGPGIEKQPIPADVLCHTPH
jgi:hypothetical protein